MQSINYISRIEELVLSPYASKEMQIQDNNKLWNYHDIFGYVQKVKYFLIKKGIRSGDRVIILSQNSGMFVFALLGTFAAKAIAVPVNSSLPAKTINGILQNANSSCVLLCDTQEEFIEKTKTYMSPYSIYHLDAIDEKEQFPKSTSGSLSDTEIYSEDALILHSSGTTNHPKGILLTHAAILANVSAILKMIKPSATDIFYTTKSIIHSSCIVGEILVGLAVGAKLVLTNPYISPNKTLRLIEEQKATHVFTNPTILKLLLKATKTHVLFGVHSIICSGSYLSDNILREAKSKFPKTK